MMSLAETWALEQGCRRFYLSAKERRAINFYQRLGYLHTETDRKIDTETIADGKQAYEFYKDIKKKI